MTEQDTRPIAEPTMFSFSPLGEKTPQEFMAYCREVWPDCQWGRWTIVSPDYPNEPYPHGIYFEGWNPDPAKMHPLHRVGPFNYPLTAQPIENTP